MRGLLIRSEALEAILSGEKVWEIRGRRTHIRGLIALIRSGSSQVVGICELVDCIGPLSLKDMRRTFTKHGVPLQNLLDGLPYNETFAWVLSNARRLEEPLKYKHRFGIITWHPLPNFKFDG